jgi:hypothetical protein
VLHLARERDAVDLADQPERHVDTGRDAGRGDEVAVAHVANVFEHLDVAPFAELLDEREVRRDPLALGEARLVEQQSARAHAGDPGALRAGLAQPLDEDRVRDLAAGALPSWDEHDVELGRVVEAVVGDHAQPLRAAHRLRRLRDRDDPVVRPQGPSRGEHLPRADEVELLGVGEDQDSGRVAHRATPCGVGGQAAAERKRAR